MPAGDTFEAAFSATTIGSLLPLDVDDGEAVLRSFLIDTAVRFDVVEYGFGLISW